MTKSDEYDERWVRKQKRLRVVMVVVAVAAAIGMVAPLAANLAAMT